jgi:hypothetical protein
MARINRLCVFTSLRASTFAGDVRPPSRPATTGRTMYRQGGAVLAIEPRNENRQLSIAAMGSDVESYEPVAGPDSRADLQCKCLTGCQENLDRPWVS